MDNDILYELKLVLEKEIKQYKDIIFEKEEILKNINKKIQDNCNHRIITDHIDQMEGYKESIQIKYCEICEKTF